PCHQGRVLTTCCRFTHTTTSEIFILSLHDALPIWPTALVDAYQADMGMVYILGMIVFIPGVMIAGILLPKIMKKLDYPVPPLLKDRKSTRLNSSHVSISYAVFCLKKKTDTTDRTNC